jgi:hypothetical protein
MRTESSDRVTVDKVKCAKAMIKKEAEVSREGPQRSDKLPAIGAVTAIINGGIVI